MLRQNLIISLLFNLTDVRDNNNYIVVYILTCTDCLDCGKLYHAVQQTQLHCLI